MSDYPMLISNKLHSFRNFYLQRYENHRPAGSLRGNQSGGMRFRTFLLKKRQMLNLELTSTASNA